MATSNLAFLLVLEAGKTREREVSLPCGGSMSGQPSCMINNIFYLKKYHLLKNVSSFIGYYFYGLRWPRKTLSSTNPTNEKLSKATPPAFAIQSLHIYKFL
jgi:hypothetical protein